MMIGIYSVALQDTVRGKSRILSDSTGQPISPLLLNQKPVSDSTVKGAIPENRKTARNTINTALQETAPADTTSVCHRNSISDVSFYFPDNIISTGKLDPLNRFPFEFTNKNRQADSLKLEILVRKLKPGQDLPARTMHDDWLILIMALALFLFSLVRSTSKDFMPEIKKFFLFRSISDPSKRKGSGLAQWQTVLLNLDSYIIISLFVYCFVSYNQIIPLGFSRILIWLIILSGIILAAGMRYVVCKMTGHISGSTEIFRDYLFGVYQSYRFSSLFLFFLIMLIRYTLFFPPNAGFVAGAIIIGVMYIFRITRLFIIFLNSNISIFYLILYLCALEILPVLITIKYFSGLV